MCHLFRNDDDDDNKSHFILSNYLFWFHCVCASAYFLYFTDLYHYNQQRFTATTHRNVCVYEFFTLTFAFVSRWYYFLFSSFLLFLYFISRAFLFSSLTSFRCSQSFHVYIRSALLANPFLLSFPLLVQYYFNVVSCSLIRVSCGGEYCISLRIVENMVSPKRAHKKWDRKGAKKV